MSLPEKLIAVGMRYNPGALQYIKGLTLPQNILLRPEDNKEATGGHAYALYHRGTKLAYVREADLPKLKMELSGSIGYNTSNAYDIVEVRDNYLVLKLVKPVLKLQSNPCAEIYLQDSVCTSMGVDLHPANTVYASAINPLKQIDKKGKENMFDKIVNANKAVAVSAAYLEAGRIANNQVTKLVAAKAPLMVKGYVDTPVGKVVLANLTNMAIEQFRPSDLKLQKVGKAMMTEAYQELIQTIDIEGMLNELTSSEGIKNALAAVTEADPVKA